MPKKILLADDSITIQKVVELTFSDGDYEVTAVNNGAKAVQKLAEMRPDIILSDIIMPEKNGYEVCEYIKSHPEFRSIPVVLLTGTFEPFDPDRAEKAGCDAVVTKPFESQSLIHKVEELISQAKANRTVAVEAAPAPPAEPPSPWMDETPAPSEPFAHDNDIFAAAPPVQATTEMPFELPSTPAFNDSSFASPADTPFGEPAGEAFGGETRAFPRMTFDEMQQMANAASPAAATPPPPPPPPAPEPSPWDEPADSGETRAFTKMSFDDFAASAPAPELASPEPENESPFGAPPPIEEFSSETRAFPRMSLEEMQQMTSGGLSLEQPGMDQPSVTPEPPPAPAPEPPQATSPWDEPEAPAFGGETRAFPKLSFDDFQSMSPAPEPQQDASPFASEAPFSSDADAPAFGGETRAFPKLSFDDFQSMSAPTPEPEVPQYEAAPEPEPVAESSSPFAADEPAAAPEAGWMAPAAEPSYSEPSFDEQPSFSSEPSYEPQPLEAPMSFSEQPVAEDMPFAAEPAQEEEAEPVAATEEPSWSLSAGATETAEAEAESQEPAVAPAPAALAPEAAPAAARSESSDLTDEQIDRIARRVVELISDQVVRNIAWEVIPDLAEMVVKERIRQLEAEA